MTVDPIAAPVHSRIDSVAAQIQALVDAIAPAIQTVRKPGFAFSARPVRQCVEPVVDAITLGIKPFVNSISSGVEPIVDDIAARIKTFMNPFASDIERAVDAIAEPVEKSIRRHCGNRAADRQYGEPDHYAFFHCANTPVCGFAPL
jgi:phage-related protein